MNLFDATIEEIVLAAAMSNREALVAVASLPEDTFTSSDRMEIHAAIRDTFLREGAATMPAVYSSFPSGSAAGQSFLSILQRQQYTMGWRAAVEKARHLRFSRRVAFISDGLKDVLTHNGPDEAMAFVQHEITEVWRQGSATDPSCSDVGMDILDGVPHLPFGIHDLDQEFKGIPIPSLVTIGARPSIGKTAFALALAGHWATAENRVDFFSLEMPKTSLQRRIISSKSGVDGTSLRTGALSAPDYARGEIAVKEMQQTLAMLKIHDRQRAKDAIFSEANKAVEMGSKVIIVDHIGLVRGHGKRERRDLQIADYMAQCAEFVQRRKVIWINLSQLVRGAEGEEPSLADLRESGSIEQDSDIVMLLHRERDGASRSLDVNVAKFRDGRVCKKTVYFDSTKMKLGNAPHYAGRFQEGFEP